MMANTDWQGLLILGVGWVAYYGLHSILASSQVKSWIAARFPSAIPGIALSTMPLHLVACFCCYRISERLPLLPYGRPLGG